MKRFSVKWKIIVVTVFIFLTVTGTTSYLSIESQKRMVLDSAERHAEDLADGYFEVLNTMMLTGTIANREIFRKKMERNPEILSVRPIRSEHINNQYPGDHEHEKPQDALDHRALEGERVLELSQADDGRKLTIIKPAIARPKLPGETLSCTNCHTVDEGTVLGAVRLEFSLATRDKQVESQVFQTLGINLGLLVLGIGLLYLIMNRSVVHPILSLQQVMGKLETGDLTQSVPAKDKNDEIGDIGRSIDSFSGTLRGDISEIQERAVTLAERSESLIEVSALLVHNATSLATQTQETLTSTDGVDRQVSRMTGSANGISLSVHEVLEAAQLVATSMSEVNEATRDVEESIMFIATSSEEMNATIQEIAANANQTQELTTNAALALEKGVSRIHELSQTTRKIEDSVFEVEEIAELTQNLALNATIEAAKAGSAGAGFRVVADEVRGLAKQTSHATEVIQERVAAILQVTEEVVGEIATVNKMVSGIKDKINEVAVAVEEQSVTTANNAQHIQDMVRTIKEVAGHVTRAEGSTKDIAKQIASVSEQADQVKASASSTQKNTQRIIDSIREVGQISDREKAHAKTVETSAEALTNTAERLKEMIARFKVK